MGEPSELLEQLQVARAAHDTEYVVFTAWMLWRMGDDLANLALERLVGETLTLSTSQAALTETATDDDRFEALTDWCVDFVHRRPSGKSHPRQWLPRRISELQEAAEFAELAADPDSVTRSTLVKLLMIDDELRARAELPELKHADAATTEMLGRYEHTRARLIRAAGGFLWSDAR
ncbi:MAG: hypothetical protein WA988_06150 [Candidatus Nanopelagicales bacterium]|jgi:hypothetical protein